MEQWPTRQAANSLRILIASGAWVKRRKTDQTRQDRLVEKPSFHRLAWEPIEETTRDLIGDRTVT
jgi:hypothetical protein